MLYYYFMIFYFFHNLLYFFVHRSIGGIGAQEKDSDFFYSFTSFIYPSIIYHVQLNDGCPNDVTRVMWKEVRVKNLDSSLFQVNQVCGCPYIHLYRVQIKINTAIRDC